jgi:hypothetical protein
MADCWMADCAFPPLAIFGQLSLALLATQRYIIVAASHCRFPPLLLINPLSRLASQQPSALLFSTSQYTQQSLLIPLFRWRIPTPLLHLPFNLHPRLAGSRPTLPLHQPALLQSIPLTNTPHHPFTSTQATYPLSKHGRRSPTKQCQQC